MRYSLGMALFHNGDFSKSLAHFERGVSLYRKYCYSCSTPLHGIDIGVTCPPIYAARVSRHLGHPERALKNIQEGLALARQTPHAYSLAHASDWAAAVHLHRGEAVTAKEQAKAVITLAEEHGFEYLGVRATVFLGAALCRQGLFDEGIAQIAEELERHTRLKTKHL